MAEYLELLKNLIKTKSYSGQEDDIRLFIKKWFHGKKVKTQIQDKNIIAFIKGSDSTKAFIFNSHMDTVSKGDIPWKYGPWKPTMEGKKLIGLGASDMKSGLTTSMLLASVYANNKPPVDLWFTYVTEEEFDGTGTKNFANWFEKQGYTKKYKEIGGIFTEPSNLKEIEYGHRGNLFLKAESHGDSGHASKPSLIKVHAVRRMFDFAEALKKELVIWQKKYAVANFDPPSIGEFTSIQAGVGVKEGKVEVESPNKFPSVCVATFDVRTTPSFHNVAFKKVEDLGKKFKIKISYAYPPGPVGYTEPEDKIIKIAKKIIPNLKLTVSKGSADLGFLSKIGIKAIIFGPGEKDEAHKVNEFCFPEQIPQAVEIYKKIVETWAKD